MSEKRKRRVANWTFLIGVLTLIFGALCLLGYILSRLFAMKADFYIEFTVTGVILTVLGSFLRSRLKKDEPEIKDPVPVKAEPEKLPEWESEKEEKPEIPVQEQQQEEAATDVVEPVELDDNVPDTFVYSDKDSSIRSKMSDLLGDWSKWQEYDNDPIKVRNTCKNLKEFADNLLQSDEIYLNSKLNIDYDQFSACLKALWGSINGAMYNLSLFVKNDGNRLILPSEDEIRLISSMCDIILSYTETVYGIG